MQFVNPMIYPLFVYWYPFQNNRTLFLIICFALGFSIDIFSDSLALHTLAISTIAFFRPLFMRFCFGANFELQGFSFKNTTRVQRYSLLFLLFMVHHLIYFTLEIFSFSHFVLILKKFFLLALVA